MKTLIKIFICIFSISILMQSCRQDFEDEMLIKDQPPAPTINVYGNILGKIFDAQNNPVADAEIVYGNDKVRTDEFGVFLMKDAKMNAAGTYVQVVKEGYFTGSRLIYPRENSTSYVEVMLLDKTIIGSVVAEEGGKLSMSNGASIELPKAGIIDASGSTYDGTVNVAMQWLNPISDDLGQMMPGSLEAINGEDSRVVLQSYGMLAIELESTSGEALNLGNGGVAELSFPVPAEIIDVAPATIPLWFFDEEVGIWLEEGVAELVGNEYIGKVSHFTFWNCDVPFPLIQLSGCFQDAEGGILANTTVEIEVISTGLNGFTNTNNRGCFLGPVPMNEALLIRLIAACGTVVYEEEIGPFDSDTNLGTIIYDFFGGSDMISLQGTLVDCDNLPLESGILRVKKNEEDEFFYVEGGSFDVSTVICPGTSSIFLSGAEPLEDQTTFSDLIEFPVEDIVNVGNLSTCIDPTVLPDTYAKVTIDGDSYIYDLSSTTGGDSYAQMNTNGLEVWMSFRNIFQFDSTAATFIYFGLEEGDNLITQGSSNFSNFNGLFDIGENISFKAAPFAEKDIFISELGEVGEPVSGTVTHELILTEAELISITPTGVSLYPGDTLGVFPISIDFRVIRK